jgi:hypothetical protein
MYTLPFLYLPDAFSLILLLVVLRMLRKAAIDHIQQELLVLRKDMLIFWIDNSLDCGERGYVALSNLLGSAAKLAPGLSPGRLIFIYRQLRMIDRSGTPLSFPDPMRDVRVLIEQIENIDAREKLKRIQMEMCLGMGMFFLLGSLSGWLLFWIIIARILKRTAAHYQNNRIDFFFDMIERAMESLGRQVQQIGYIADL